MEDLQSLRGTPVQDVWQPTPTSVVLGVGGRLLLLEHAPFPRLHPVRRRPRSPATPFSFQGLLRARLHGPVDDVRVVGDDRVVEIAVGRHVLHARLFGRGGGIWLLEDGVVIGSAAGPALEALPALPPRAPDPTPPRFAPGPGEGWAEAAARWFEARVDAHRREDLAERLAVHLDRVERKERRLLAALEEDLASADRADAWRHLADCLAAAAHTVPRGVARVEVPDVYAPGSTVIVPLDPSRPPGENVRRLYERARRLERAGEQVLVRYEEVRRRLDELAADRARLASADLAELRALATRWSLPEPGARRAPTAASPPWATWVGPRGETLLIGRSDAGNHALVFRRARGRDWWVHVRDRPGAHVVIPTDRAGAAPPLDLLLAAAQLAFQVARVPAGETLDVQYARVADLRPIRGAGPGKVQVRDERVLHVTSDPSRLDGWTRR